jgi:uncharacterized protein (DUF1499 family)
MRRLPAEPVPLLAPVSRGLAVGAVCAALLSIIATRYGGVAHANGLLVFGAAVLLAVLAMVAALSAFVRIWRTGAPGAGVAARGLCVALIVLAWPAYLAGVAAVLPVINDVTTDKTDPPSFSRSRAALDARQGHVPPEYDRQGGAEQADDDNGLQTIPIEQPADAVMLLAQRAVTNLGWAVVDTANPSGRTQTGRIDAVARSLVFRFPDDLTIRVRQGADETRVDVRSVSRIGRHDFGANTRHVRDFTRELEALAAGR